MVVETDGLVVDMLVASTRPDQKCNSISVLTNESTQWLVKIDLHVCNAMWGCGGHETVSERFTPKK